VDVFYDRNTSAALLRSFSLLYLVPVQLTVSQFQFSRFAQKRIAPVLVKVSNSDAGIDVMREEVGDDEMMLDSNSNNNNNSPQKTSKPLTDIERAKQIVSDRSSNGNSNSNSNNPPTTVRMLVPRPKKKIVADTSAPPPQNTNSKNSNNSKTTQNNSRGDILTPPISDSFDCQLPPIDTASALASSSTTTLAAINTKQLPTTHTSTKRTSPQSNITISSAKHVWKDVITGTTSALAGNSAYVVAGTTQGELHIWKRFGPEERR